MDDDDLFTKGGLANALKWYAIFATPLLYFHAVSWVVHREYRARMQATKDDCTTAEVKNKRSGNKVLPLPLRTPASPQTDAQTHAENSSIKTSIVCAVAPNLRMVTGANRRGPTDSKAAVPPPKYAGESVAKMGLVVKLAEAVEHWNLGLDRGAYSQRNHARPTRYEVDGKTPFVMISYNAGLRKNGLNDEKIETCPHGRAAIDSLLQQLQAQGWEYVWWDWIVCNDEHGVYVQQEFESAMTWAQESAYEVAVLWPKPSDALAYMARPWCLSEILACTRRGAHLVYSQPGDFWLSKDGAGFHATIEKCMYPIILAAGEAYTAFFYVFGSVLFFANASSDDLNSNGDTPEWILPLLLSFFLSYCVMFARFYLNKALGSGRVENYQLFFPVDLIEYLTTSNTWKKTYEERIKLVSNLCEVGHLTGVMFDLGDTMGCGALLGYEKPWRFAFEQATILWRNTWVANNKPEEPAKKEPLLPWERESLKRKQAFAGHNASWLNGVDAEPHDESDAVSKSFTGAEILWLSLPNSKKQKDSSTVKLALITPLAPLQCMKLTTSLKRPFLVGAEQIKLFFAAISLLTACSVPVAAYAGSGFALLTCVASLIPHFMVAAGYFTLVSGSKLYVFCSMIQLVQVGFLFWQLLVSATALDNITEDTLADDWPIAVAYTIFFLWCIPHAVIGVIYLCYFTLSRVCGCGENTSFRKVC